MSGASMKFLRYGLKQRHLLEKIALLPGYITLWCSCVAKQKRCHCLSIPA